ncbi:MAG: tetratricopeptide repeat protein [Gallionellaceae bacterium]|nr:tetratricopeptide repeat protein [Gallionellaceae bacterium]
MRKTGRNDPCPCNSGKKYKQCCQRRDETSAANQSLGASLAILQAALAHHQAGRLPQANTLYRQILQVAPDDPDALHFSGLIAHQTGKNEAAIELIGKAILFRPDYADAHYNLGIVLQEQGRLDDAAASYRRALAFDPDYADAHNNLGNVLHDQGQLGDAAASYRRALALNPNYADTHNNLGNVFQEQGKLDDAIASYRRALALNPDYADAHNNLGNVLQEQGKLDDAVASYRRALALKPDYADAHYNLGNVLQKQGKLDEAVASYRRVLAFKPDYAAAHNNLGNVLHEQVRPDKAVESDHQTIRPDSKNESAEHLISALTAKTPERAPSQYIEKLFDGYANKFDTHLVRDLEYKMPSELVALLKQSVEFPVGEWDVLDLGCGTGLAGLEISPHAKQLAGVDLSTKMLARAHARNVYHRLVHSDLLPMMRGEETSSYDMIIAADVFVYLGMLDEIVSEAKRLLRAGGYFMFSVEALEALPIEAAVSENKLGYRLNQSGRYAHSASYLERLASASGFTSLSMISTPVRLEDGLPIPAWAAVWKS